jgi:hypothetical protein
MRSRLLGIPLTLVGGAGFAAALAALYVGMRHVMRTQGGFCASGGPYAIAHRCSGSDTQLILFGVFGMLLGGLALLIGLGLLEGPLAGVGLAMWAALFGVLGWNFISLGFSPPRGMSGGGGWIASGVVFWLMAAGGLIPLLVISLGWARDRGAKGAYG